MSVPAGSSSSPVEEALDRLDERAAGSGISDEDVATVRGTLERLTEERDKARDAFNRSEDAHDDTKQKLWRDRGAMLDLQKRAEAAEAEVRRLTGLDEAVRVQAEREPGSLDTAIRARLADSPPVRPEGREGIVTVYDHENRYLGCMGRETWENLLASPGGGGAK